MESYRQYRAPAHEGATLVDPSWSEQLAWLTNPPARPTLSIGALNLRELAASARQQLLADAARYTRQYADVDTPSAGRPLVLSGHQPELFHPGVWFKNFALDALAKRASGVGVHLLIDSDLCRAPSIRVPTGSVAEPRAETIAYDAVATTVPYEERAINDPACFDSFAERTVRAVEPFVANPLVTELWRHAVAARDAMSTLASALSAGRHVIEREAGSTTLELPASQVADAEPFRRFAAELLARAAEVAEAYNAALADYRSAHRLKNAAQPLPDLETDASVFETPLWVWSEEDPTRRALFVEVRDGALTLSDRAGWHQSGPLDVGGIVDWLSDLRSEGLKIRSRALVTTLYGRLVLSDLFLHGIGGAKYDQVTDRFAERLFGMAPPPHATLSATLRLPIEHQHPSEADRRALTQRQRELRYHPEKFIDSDAPAVVEAIETKRRWIETPKTPDNAAERHAAIVGANAVLAGTLQHEQQAAKAQLNEVERRLRDAALLDSREHSLVLFPRDQIVESLKRATTVRE
ncbi:MAG: hypothetical protein AAF266_00215 [Planctomycetota bacterium]